MDALTAAAASGIQSRMQSLDILANNLANASTPGFKADAESYGLYYSSESPDSPADGNTTPLPVLENQWTDFSQGAMLPTSNATDLALNGKGFFVVTTPSGPLFTRNGNFHVSGAGQLQTQEGYAVQGSDGQPIVLDPAQAFEVTSDGSVQQGGQQISQIAVVNFDDPTVLAKRGGNYFRSTISKPPAPAPQPDVQQGKLESGNSQSSQSAARLTSILRQFESLQKAMAIGADMNRRTVEEVAKVS
jgi:flagellar basal-body rod protein FlgF